MKQFKSNISSDNPLVSDHRINGACVLPGVAYLDMCARCLNKESFVLTNIHYPNALIVPENETIALYMDYDAKQSEITIYHWQNEHKVVHFNAFYNHEICSEATINKPSHLPTQRVTMQAMYRLAVDAHISHGPFMKVSGDAAIDEQQIDMCLSLSAQAKPYLQQFYLHPALLDGATFAIAALHFTVVKQLEQNQLYLPLSIDRIEVYRRIEQDNVIVWAEKQSAPPGLIKCNLTLSSLDGQPYIHFAGLCNKQFHIQQLFTIKTHTSEIKQALLNQPLEQQILAILAGFIEEALLLQSKQISFFDLGFDSSQLMACAAQLEVALQIPIYPTLLFEYNTFEKLLTYLSSLSNVSNEEIEQTTQLSLQQDYTIYQPSYRHLLLSNEPASLSLLKRKIGEGYSTLSSHALDTSYLDTQESITTVIGDLALLIKHIQAKPYCFIIQVSTQQQALFAALKGLVLSFNKESASLQLKLLMADRVDSDFAARLIKQQDCLFKRYRTNCYVPTLQNVALSTIPNQLKQGGRYLIVGGGNGLSKIIRTYLIKHYAASIAVIGHRLSDPSCEAQQLRYDQVNINDEQAIRRYLQQGLPFDGIFFLAGRKQDGLFLNAVLADIESVFAVKPLAFQTLLKAFDETNISFVCAFSSLSADIGQHGQTIYAAANSLLNHVAQQAELKRLTTGKGPKVISISWPYWQDGGMQLSPSLVDYFSQQYKTAPLSTKMGLTLLEELLAHSNAHLIVANERLLHLRKADFNETSFPEEIEKCSELSDNDIAIIGLSFTLPGSNDFEQLHQNLSLARSSIKTVNRGWSEIPYAWGGYLDDIDHFDPLFFNISPNEAKCMDPQERLFLSHAWHCLEDAGYASKKPQAIGVIAAAMFNSYQNFAIEKQSLACYPQSILASIANRVSYVCNLTGPSFSIDSMCSSAFNALDLACQHLQAKPVDAMLVGAVNICSHPYKLAALIDNKFLSPNGHSSPFSAQSNGYVPGEGVVVLLLKKAKKAIADGDNIYGIIKAVVSSHGGLGKGFTVPSAPAQAETIKQALAQAKLSIEEIDYIEAHGTSTALGDPIEVEGLHQVFSKRHKPLYFGSIKSNIGHLEPVAGFASLIKVLSQFKHNTIYPSIHAHPLNAALMPYLHTLQVATELKTDVLMRFAGISCFGAGGSKTHCIIQNVQRNQIYHAKTRYDTQSYWLDNITNNVSVQILQRLHKPVSQLIHSHEDLIVHQPEVKSIPSYFGENKTNASAYLYVISTADCWNKQIATALICSLADKPLVCIIVLAQCQASWMMAHALIASSSQLKSALIKCIYIEALLSKQPDQIRAIIKQEFTSFEHRLVYYNDQLQRFISEFKPLTNLSINVNISSLRNQRIAILGGLGAIGMQFCLALNKLGITTYDIYGRSLAEHKQSELNLLGNQARYIVHDFITAPYSAHGYDVIINCMGLMPDQVKNDASQRKKLKDHYTMFIKQARPTKIVSLSSLSVLVGFGDEPDYALDNAFVHAITDYCVEHVILYCPLILTPALQQQANQTWLDWSEKNQGLLPLSLDDFQAVCPQLLAFPAGEYLPFMGHLQRLQNYLQQSLQLAQANLPAPGLTAQNNNLLIMVEELLGIPADKIDCTISLQELGFTSLTLASFAQRLTVAYQQDFNPSRFFEIRSLNDLKAMLSQLESRVLAVQSSNSIRNDPIVICSYECQFPGSNNADLFWQNLEQGKECTQTSLMIRFGQAAPNGNMGLLDEIDRFDHQFFGISAEEAKWIDPQQRKLLHLSWHLFENAGIAPSTLQGESVGVFVAIQFDDYARLVDRQDSLDVYQVTGCAKNFAANRISNFYDFHGPSEIIDTACSSSLSALDRALQALHRGECDYALVMGVSLLCSIKTFELTQQLQILSSDGHCRPFDAHANGYVKGEGIAGLLLTKKAIAEAKRWRIDGQISGLAVNHGGRAQSLTAPNGLAQQAVMRKAYEYANLSPGEINYIEAHATATTLGDPVEYQAIVSVFGEGRDITLGSVKANIGHTEPVAGLAGIIKALKMLAYQKLPKQINFTKTNQYINLKPPFSIASETVSKHLEHIGVNSFGFGGSNGHCIVTHVKQHVKCSRLPYSLLVLSAKTQQGLITLQKSWQAFLQANLTMDLTAACKTLALGRDHFAYRACWVLDPTKDLSQQLEVVPTWPILDKLSIETPLHQLDEIQLHAYLSQIASFFMAGNDVNWATLYQGIESVPIVLPSYPFARISHWFEELDKEDKSKQGPLQIYTEEWQPCELKWVKLDRAEPILFIVHSDQQKNIKTVISSRQLTAACIVLTDDELYQSNLLAALKQQPKYIYYLGNLTNSTTDSLESLAYPHQQALLYFLQSINIDKQASEQRLYFITSKAIRASSHQSRLDNPHAAAMFGFVQSFCKEVPSFFYQCLDIADINLLPQALNIQCQDDSIYYFDGKMLYTRKLVLQTAQMPSALLKDKVIVLVGGSGQVGRQLIPELLMDEPLHCICLSRTKINLGKDILHYAVDCTDKQAFLDVINQIITRYQRIDYLIHLSSSYEEKAVTKLNYDDYLAQIKAKVLGTQHCLIAAQNNTIKHVVICSSVQVYTQNENRGAYTAACLYSDALVQQYNLPNVSLLHWGFWQQADESLNRVMREAGIEPINGTQGCAALRQVLATNQANVSCFLVNDSVKAFMPIASKCSEELLVVVEFHRKLQELEDYAADVLWSTLIRHGIVVCKEEHTQVNSNWVTKEYQNYVSHLIVQLEQFACLRQYALAVLNVDQLLLARLQRFADDKTLQPFLNLFDHCVSLLPKVLNKQLSPQEVLFPNGCDNLVKGVYQQNPLAQFYNRLLAREVHNLCDQHSNLQILEIGAGTGATTDEILTAGYQHLHYTFTDINEDFIKQAQMKFADYNTMHFQRFDINYDEADSAYDLIIASNALHTCEHLPSALLRLSRSLRLGGYLIINESIQSSLFLNATFGLFPQWHQQKQDTRIAGSPLLRKQDWQHYLKQAGFEVNFSQSPEWIEQTVIIACLKQKQQGSVQVKRNQFQDKAIKLEKALQPSTHSFRQLLAEVLEISPDEVHLSRSMKSYGLDSLAAIHLVQVINRTYGLNLSPMRVLQDESIEQLIEEYDLEYEL